MIPIEKRVVSTNTPYIFNSYYQWLYQNIRINTDKRSYFLLVKALHQKEFYWTIPRDDNRAMDGRGLREDFFLDCSLAGVISGPCTMLEMLIGLSRRMGGILYDPDKGDQMSVWFWEMMSNCGLGRFTDEDFMSVGGEYEVQIILNRILERTYKRNGEGGLFPLKYSNKDQRKVEIWYQMNQYVVEKYYIEDGVV